MKFTCLFLIGMLYFINPVKAQKTLSFTLNKQNLSCEFDSVKTNLYITINQLDSVIPLSFIKNNCIYSVQIPTELYTSKIIIKSDGFYEETIPIALKPEYPDSLFIGEIRLGKQKTKILSGVTITGIPKDLIKMQGNKTIIQVKDNDILTISSVFDAIKKIPGSFITPNGDINYQGKGCEIYLDGLPSNLMGPQLIGYLQSLPATSVERIEIILNPGAAYDANLQGAIFDIITKGSTSKWVAGSVSLNYGRNQNDKLTPSMVLNGKRKKYSWQLQSGISSIESSSVNDLERNFITFSPIKKFSSAINTQNLSNSFYFKPSFSFKINKKSNLIVNYNLYSSNSKLATKGNNNSIENNFLFQNTSNYRTKSNNNELIAKYKNNLDTLGRTLEIIGYSSFNDGTNSQELNQTENNSSMFNFLSFNNSNRLSYLKIDLHYPIRWCNLNTGLKLNTETFQNTGKYNFNTNSNYETSNSTFSEIKDFQYSENKGAAYVEMDKTIQKWNFGGGLRWESNLIYRSSNVFAKSLNNNYHNLFPNAYVNYSFTENIIYNLNYTRKIDIPTANEFDPNNTNYYDKYFKTNGNFYLKPKFYDNLNTSITAFNYVQLSANFTRTYNENVQQITADPSTFQVTQTTQNFDKVDVYNFTATLPVPFLFFKEGKKMFQKAINPEELNYLFLYSTYNMTRIEGYNFSNSNPHIWVHGVSSHFVLPFKIDLSINYNFTSKGNYQIFYVDKPIHYADITLNKSFLKKKLNTSLSISDPFNTNQTVAKIGDNIVSFYAYNKHDTRVVYVNLTYSFGKHKNLMNEKTVIEKEVKEKSKGMF